MVLAVLAVLIFELWVHILELVFAIVHDALEPRLVFGYFSYLLHRYYRL